MHSVILSGVDQVTAAAEWCIAHVEKGTWTMNFIAFFGDNRTTYEFKFDDPEVANLVKLKWL